MASQDKPQLKRNVYKHRGTCPTNAARMCLGQQNSRGTRGQRRKLRHQAGLALAKITELSQPESATRKALPPAPPPNPPGRDGARGGRLPLLYRVALADESTHSYLLSTYYIPTPVEGGSSWGGKFPPLNKAHDESDTICGVCNVVNST